MDDETITAHRASIDRAITALQILDLRLAGQAQMIPGPFAKFTDRQIAAAAAMEMGRILINLPTDVPAGTNTEPAEVTDAG